MKMQPSRNLALLALACAVAALMSNGCASGANDSNSGNPSPTSGSNPPPVASAPTGGATPGTGTPPATEVSLATGDAVFKVRCEMCHGPSGMGDGPAGQALNPRPRNFHDKAYMTTLTDAVVESTILNGKPGTAMPPHKGLVNQVELQSLVLKVRSFSKS